MVQGQKDDYSAQTRSVGTFGHSARESRFHDPMFEPTV